MKKIYLFLFLVMAFFSAKAQTVLIDDDFDSYNPGFIAAQSPHWGTWSGAEGGGEDGQVTNNLSASSPNSLLIMQNNDVILILGDKTSGVYTVQFDIYINSGDIGYYNIQQFGVPGDFAGQIYFRDTGFMEFDFSTVSVPYPANTWFTVKNVIDLDGATIQVYLDGTEIVNAPYTGGSNLGGIDFFGTAANNIMYVDNVIFAEGILATTHFQADSFSLYPNPIKDVLNIQSTTPVDAVTIYNLLGKVILSSNPGIISPSISTSSLSSGIYLVKITSGGISKTIKVSK